LELYKKEGKFYYADDLQVERTYNGKDGNPKTTVSSHGKIGKNHISDIFQGFGE